MNSDSYESALSRLQHVTEYISIYYSTIAESLGMTTNQFEIVFFVLNHQPCSISEIANALLLDTSTVSRILEKLVFARWLSVEQDAEDKRKKLITVITNGDNAELLNRAIAQWIAVDEKVNTLYGGLIEAFENKISQG